MNQRIGRTAVAALLVLGIGACSESGGPESDNAENDNTQTHTVETAKGPVDVPEDPDRVVVLDTGELDNALALGVTPVGAVTTDVDSEFLGYLGDRTDGIESVGTITEPNLEEIAALEPDVILSSVIRHGPLYDQLSEIAPTVLSETVGYPWKQNLQLNAEALDREQRADELMAAYDQKAAKVDAKIDDGAVISLVRFIPGETRLYSDKSFSGVVLDDVGATVPPAAKGADTFIPLSDEKLGLADGDYILTSTYGAVDDTDQAEITDSGLWTGLDAVEAGRVAEVDDDLISGIGILAADGLLDQLADAVG
ncbi:MAG: ABC transporter substrate-binding protein [Nocardioidaceae bacterium]